jgi:hypothetical protein
MLFFNDSLISAKSKMQECVTLSVAEADLMALNACVQEMIYVKQLIELMNLNVKLPTTIKVDKKVNNWSIGGRTRHVGEKLNYPRELKEDGIIQADWIRSEKYVANILTKKLPAVISKKYGKLLGVGY